MSKKKRARKVAPIPLTQFIHSSLRTDFYCTEEEIELIDQALIGRCPIEIADHINNIIAGKVPLRIRPTICLDVETGRRREVGR